MSLSLQARGLRAGYGRKAVVHGVDFLAREGRILLILGHNGAGKTTLVKTMFGLLTPMAGEVRLGAQDITARSPAQNVRDGYAFIPQGHGIFRSLSVADNLSLGGFTEQDAAQLAARQQMVFKLFPILEERAKQIGGTLSGGQQQMLAIGMALMHGPKLMVLDEPSIGLAPNLVEKVMRSIREINQTLGTTIVIVEQNVKASLPVADDVIVLKTGSKVYEGLPEPLQDPVFLMSLF
jgi:branched-chain amino acid transport system ATP-binding protein